VGVRAGGKCSFVGMAERAGLVSLLAMGLSVAVWSMMGLAVWHFTVFLPPRFWGGIIGAFLVSLAGALASGVLLPQPGIPLGNPPGVAEALWAVPGAIAALWISYRYGSRRDRARGITRV
jgi:hypothetical protein